MFREMRRGSKKLSQEEAIDILCSGEYGILGTVGEEGYPYTIPINYAYKDDVIYLHSALEGHKLDNIGFNNQVSFSVVGETEVVPEEFTSIYESVTIFGTASLVEGEEKRQGLIALIDKYSTDFKKEGIDHIDRFFDTTAVIKIEIKHMTGKASRK